MFCFSGPSALLDAVFPALIEEQSGEDEGEADGRAHRPLDVEVHRQRRRAEDKNRWHEGIANGAVGPEQVWFTLAQTEEGRDGERVENPLREDEQGEEVLKLSGEHHCAGHGSLKEERNGA